MTYDIWVDFQRVQDDGHLLTRTRNARPGLTITAGMYLLVGCEDAEPAVAQVACVTAEGSVELLILPGAATEHLALLQGTA